MRPLVPWNQASSVAGDDVREMELEKLAQDPGDDCSGMLASGPNWICEGTMCRGLALAKGKGVQSTLRPVLS